jgi:hypothetical protein
MENIRKNRPRRPSGTKIDPDTGLQFDEGPSRNQYITVSARHYFRAGLLQASVPKADARGRSNGKPVPEAPRLIVDVLGTDASCFEYLWHGRLEAG